MAPTVAAAPVFSIPSGAVAPASTTTPTTTTSGGVIIYRIDGGTPAHTNSPNGDLFPIPPAKIFRPSNLASFIIYGPMTIKAITVATGLTDSSVTTASYTLTAPTGTALSSCNTITSSGTYYLSANVTGSGNCMQIEADNVVLNLNGHTATYGTGDGPLASGSDGVMVASSCDFTTASSAPFTSGMVGDQLYAIQTGSGAYQNYTGDITVFNSSSSITVDGFGATSGCPAWSGTATTYIIAPPVIHYGVDCDWNLTGSSTCKYFHLYNGTITQSSQSALGRPDSYAVSIGNAGGDPDNATTVIANVTANVSGQEVGCFIINHGTAFGNIIRQNVCNDTSTYTYVRDNLYYPIKLVVGGLGSGNGSGYPATSPVSIVADNLVNGSPFGGAKYEESTNSFNNNMELGPIQFANGYGTFTAACGSLVDGDSVAAAGGGPVYSRAFENESCNNTFRNVYANTIDNGTVYNPNHDVSPPCEPGGNETFRTKDYSTAQNIIYGALYDHMWLISQTGACQSKPLSWTQGGSADGGTVSNSSISVDMATNISPSAFYRFDGVVASGWTFTNNTLTATDTYSTLAYDVLLDYDGANGVNIALPPNPTVYNDATAPSTPATAPTTATFTGTGTLNCTHASGATTNTIKMNGITVPCP
jgi:hypothetical protein